MTDSPEDAVNALLDAGDPESWKFQEDGPRVVGKLLNADSANTKHGPVPILILQVEGKPRSVWLMHTAIRNKVKRAFENGSLQFGDYVGIQHLGKSVSNEGTEYENYDLRIVPTGERSNFGVFGPATDAPAALEAGIEDAEVVNTWAS